jgi:general secretion pathway protein K
MRCPADRGAALVTVLMIVALASVTVADIVAQQHTDVRLTRSREALGQASYVAQGAERWAQAVLFQDRKDSDIDSLDEDWATILPPVPIEGGQVGGLIEDMQARINLNNLLTKEGKVSAVDVERLQRLLSILELDPNVVLAIQDWMDKDLQPSDPFGAEDDYYSTLERPYRAANRLFTSITELRLVRGIDDEAYQVLAPHVSALPERTGVNVNTAGNTVLRALADHISEIQAEQFIGQREEEPFDKVQAFTNHPLHGGQEVDQASLSVNSEFFRTRGEVELGPIRLQVSSWMQRSGNGVTRVYQRMRGTD